MTALCSTSPASSRLPLTRVRIVSQSRSEPTPFPLYDATLAEVAKTMPVSPSTAILAVRRARDRREGLWRKAEPGLVDSRCRLSEAADAHVWGGAG